MSPAARHRVYAWMSAAVAASGLLVFGWSPTELLLLYWLDNAVYVLAPLLMSLVVLLTTPRVPPGERAGALLVMGLLTTVFAGFIVAHGAMILFFDLASRPQDFGLPFGQVPVVPLWPLILSLVGEPSFLVSAAIVAGNVLADLWPELAAPWRAQAATPTAGAAPAGTHAPADARARSTWLNDAATRILVTQAALLFGALGVMILRLPAAAALLLIALKLWLDLRRASRL